MTHEAEIAKTLMPYIVLYPNNKITDEALKMYARVLSPLSVEEIDAAMSILCKTVKFFPSVAEIFEAAKSVREYAEGSTLPTAAEAWQEVQQLVRTRHIYKPWFYSCAEVQKAAECYGRYELCNLLESEVGIARAQFCKMYNEIVQRSREQKQNEEVLSRLPQSKRDALTGNIVNLAEAKTIEGGAA